jgi:leucyl aminopeptidase
MVGKGIVYDTGGLSIKATAGMCGMKFDKGRVTRRDMYSYFILGGACASLQAFSLIVQQSLNITVHSLLCLAGNNPFFSNSHQRTQWVPIPFVMTTSSLSTLEKVSRLTTRMQKVFL